MVDAIACKVSRMGRWRWMDGSGIDLQIYEMVGGISIAFIGDRFRSSSEQSAGGTRSRAELKPNGICGITMHGTGAAFHPDFALEPRRVRPR